MGMIISPCNQYIYCSYRPNIIIRPIVVVLVTDINKGPREATNVYLEHKETTRRCRNVSTSNNNNNIIIVIIIVNNKHIKAASYLQRLD